VFFLLFGGISTVRYAVCRICNTEQCTFECQKYLFYCCHPKKEMVELLKITALPDVTSFNIMEKLPIFE